MGERPLAARSATKTGHLKAAALQAVPLGMPVRLAHSRAETGQSQEVALLEAQAGEHVGEQPRRGRDPGAGPQSRLPGGRLSSGSGCCSGELSPWPLFPSVPRAVASGWCHTTAGTRLGYSEARPAPWSIHSSACRPATNSETRILRDATSSGSQIPDLSACRKTHRSAAVRADQSPDGGGAASAAGAVASAVRVRKDARSSSSGA